MIKPQQALIPGVNVDVLLRPKIVARVLELLLLAPLFFMIVASFFFNQTDPDYWWHVRTGQLIWASGRIPTADPFSFTAAGHSWVTQEWLTELLLYLVGNQFGYVGAVLLFGGIGALAALCVYVTCRWRGMGQAGAALLMFWSFAMSLPLVNVRPQMVTMLFLALTVVVLTRYRQGHLRAIWGLPVLMALWVNLHAGYAIGLLLITLTIVGEALAQRRGQPAAPLRGLLGVAALCCLATLLNPHGVEIIRYTLSAVTKGNLAIQQVAEWRSPDFRQPMFLVFGASVLLMLVLGAARRPLGPTDVLWTLAFTLLGLQSVRHIPLYAVVVVPLLGARLQEAFPTLRHGLLHSGYTRVAVVAWSVLMGIVLGTTTLGSTALPLQTGAEASTAGYPAGAVAYLQTHPQASKLFNQYHWGGYLIATRYPQQRVFIDGRAEIYGDDLLKRFLQINQARAGWREALDNYAIDLVLIDKDSALAAALQDESGWQELYVGDVERLFARRGPTTP